MATKNSIVESAIEYADAGLRVVRLHHILPNGACSCSAGLQCPQRSRGKHPVASEWQLSATNDSEEVIKLWEHRPLANVGILLGPDSKIIDVEFDSEEGRRTADELLGECYTATYRSGRSVHRWFAWDKSLPQVQKLEIQGLEIRIGNDGKGTQSVAPPSQHWSGVKYEWLEGLSLSEVGVITIPAPLKRLIDERWLDVVNGVDGTGGGRSRKDWIKLYEGVVEGARNDSLASYVGKALSDLRSIDDPTAVARVRQAASDWNQRNQPPLSEKEFNTTFGSILKKEQLKRAAEEATFRPTPEQQASGATNGRHADCGWRLVIVLSDPPSYRLFAPYWADRTEGGYITLSAEQMISAIAIKREALSQARYPLPANFTKIWNGTKTDPGLYERLVMAHETIDAPAEQKRGIVVAQWLHSRLSKATNADDPCTRGTPVRIAGKGVYFGFLHVWQDMAMSSDKIGRRELSELVQRIGCEEPRIQVKGKQVKLRLLTHAAELALNALVGLDGDLPSPTHAGDDDPTDFPYGDAAKRKSSPFAYS